MAVAEKRSESPSALLVAKTATGDWALAEGNRWIGTQFWLVRKERFDRLSYTVRRVEARERTPAQLIDQAAESVCKGVFRARQRFTLGELFVTEHSTRIGGYAGTPVFRLLGEDGELLPFYVNADLAAALERVTPDCEWMTNGRGGAARVDGTVPWAVVMLIRQKANAS